MSRLVAALPGCVPRRPAMYDALQVPLTRGRRPADEELTVRLDVPEGKHPVMYAWGTAVPGIGPAASAFANAVYADHTLPLRPFEAARLRIAQINGCLFCLDWRTEDATARPSRTASSRPSSSGARPRPSTTQTRIAAEYAERYALAHL